MKVQYKIAGLEHYVAKGTLEKVDYFCPKCGSKDCYEDTETDDYYEGNTYLCLKCESTFTLPSVGTFTDLKEIK